MQLRRLPGIAALAGTVLFGVTSAPAAPGGPGAPGAPGAPERPRKEIDVDFLLNYYDQDGDRSPVTGGRGTESLQVISPVTVVTWAVNDDWTLSADLGVDNITSASIDNMDDSVSGASRQDNRVFTKIGGSRRIGNHVLALNSRFSKEYDYLSVGGGLHWSVDLNQRNTTLALGAAHYADRIDLIDIDGHRGGTESRSTTDLVLGFTQVLGRRTVGSVEIDYTIQSGFLSTSFYEVILAPTPSFPNGEHVTERLPDSRSRAALGLALNHGFTDKIVERLRYRYYDDDWGIGAHTVESETHFRLPTETEVWLYPILRYHTQTASDYYAPPRTFDGSEDYITVDPDLSELTSRKYGLGSLVLLSPGDRGIRRWLGGFEVRAASYSRDDGLNALLISLGLKWNF